MEQPKTTKEKEVVHLKPNPNCKVCLGRGWIRHRNPDNNSMEIRICACVRAKVKDWPEPETEIKVL